MNKCLRNYAFLPSPSGRGAGGEGASEACALTPTPLPKGEGIFRSLATAIVLTIATIPSQAADLTCWFPSDWKAKGPQALAIANALSTGTGVTVRPRIATYPEILKAFASSNPSLVYTGSFVQVIILARGLGTPLAQGINGKEFYGSWMIYPKGQDPITILRETPAAVAYTVGASSGESGAKAATGGQAAIPTPNHHAAAAAVKVGKARAAFVKSWWWEEHQGEFPELTVHPLPGISESKNPDNILSASHVVPDDLQKRLITAANAAKAIFEVREMVPFDPVRLNFSLELMRQGGIDPKTYVWK